METVETKDGTAVLDEQGTKTDKAGAYDAGYSLGKKLRKCIPEGVRKQILEQQVLTDGIIQAGLSEVEFITTGAGLASMGKEMDRAIASYKTLMIGCIDVLLACADFLCEDTWRGLSDARGRLEKEVYVGVDEPINEAVTTEA